MPRYRRYFATGQTLFLTLACQGRQPHMRPPGVRQKILLALEQARSRHPFRHHGHVLLDDHLHLLLTPGERTRIPLLIGTFKRAALAQLGGPTAPRFWQRRYFDHVIRDADDFRRHLDYLHLNPVKHGLVERAGDWPWSSLQAWTARGVYSADWGDATPEDAVGPPCVADVPWQPGSTTSGA